MIRSLDAPKASLATRVFLRIVDGPAAGETFEVGRAGATMGRSPENQIRMNDERLSRRHAGIEFRDGSFWLSDLRSSNGTFVNQNRLNTPHRLRSGDVIRLGGVHLNVTLETAG
jgi:pSer/pThr/pTyr-binding forkhead associated (FHA) protein